MDIYKILKEMNKEIVEMQEMLYNKAWIPEFDKYLVENGYKKEIYGYGTDDYEIEYIKNNIHISLINED